VVKIPRETGVSHFVQFIGDAVKEVLQPFTIFLFGVGRFAAPYSPLLFMLYRVLSMSPVQGALILKVNVRHWRSDIRVYLLRVRWPFAF